MSESQRERARNWVNGNTAAAIAVVCGTALVPGAAALVLLSQEAIMAYHIGSIYKSEFSQQDGAALAGEIGLASVAGKILALEATTLLGPGAFVAKPAIAAVIVKLLGEAIIAYCDEKWG